MTYWKDSLLIGVKNIDDQHRKLISRIDELMEACMSGKGKDVVEKTMEFVLSYTKEHFADEEKLQAQYSYPAIMAHKMQHGLFIGNVTNLMQELKKDGPNGILTAKINKTLVDWLIHHIGTEDKKLSEHIKSKGGK